MPRVARGEPVFEKQSGDLDFSLRIMLRRNKLFGLWAAAHMGRWGEAAARYVMEIIDAALAGTADDAIVARVRGELVERGFPIAEQQVREQLELCASRAFHELAKELRIADAAAEGLGPPREA
ncbi:MAG TPA: ATPase inhibitor subunit zeta [Stellaceae bacterium]|nr:ATPase inhibitor subunit zeta [Stellaceae bacterium]